MPIYILVGCMVLGLAYYMYRTYKEYNAENTAMAEPLAAQIQQFLEHYNIDLKQANLKQIKVRVNRTDVYDDFAFMLTMRRDGVTWDFNIVNKKIATDPNKCIRFHVAFHCKNIGKKNWSLTPKADMTDEDLESIAVDQVGWKDGFEDTFLVASNDIDDIEQFLDADIRAKMLAIYENNKGNWRLQKNTISYKEPIEIDTDEKRELVYKIIDLGFDLAKKIDA